ncbi:hypothetical protein NLX67_19965 [Domibacillus sp. A3M-37]|uniref:hypothetical protein n=1 Tax=Domibacillus sp. A3M-37 TaxID=2962037 RepID=UPI0020B8B5DE|nr:hypothetical protein [Domibacillus sp. A3M-37]MCP3764621.1 hypothetical protein [Domibacillus sp. A3M-37]
MLHFIHVNGCPAEIVNEFDLVVTKALQQENIREKPLKTQSLEEMFELAAKPARFTINPSLPFAEELKKQLNHLSKLTAITCTSGSVSRGMK